VYRVRATGGQPERIGDQKDVQTTGRGGIWLGLDPNDSPLMLRNSPTSDINALSLEQK
jgi:hypothetical protein